jgi:RimJ/RimL family protein N-acetyltransferase
LSGTERDVFIAMLGEAPVGVVRFERIAERPQSREIGIQVAPEHRRRGIASAALRAATEHARRSGLKELVAHIRPENVASVRAFERVGYVEKAETVVRGLRARRYELSFADQSD